MTKKLLIVSLFLSCVFVFSGCSQQKPTISEIITPNFTSTDLPTATPSIIPSPTPTLTFTPIPSPTTTPTPTRPSIPAPTVPEVSATISVENGNRLTYLTSYGEGDLLSMQVSPDEKLLVFGTTNGVLILDAKTLERIRFLPTRVKPYHISFIDNGTKLSARDCYQGYVWTLPDGVEISHVTFIWMEPRVWFPVRNLDGCTSFPDQKWEYAFGYSKSEPKAGLYRLSDQEIIYTVDVQIDTYSISPENDLVALSSGEKIFVIQYQDGKVLTEIPESGAQSLFFYPDGEIFAAVFSNQIKFWRVDDFQLLGEVKVYDVLSTFFSPDNSILVINPSCYLE